MSRALNDLEPVFRTLAIDLLARSVEAGIAVLIVETRRTHEQHLLNVLHGVSWTHHSLHEDGLAIDIVPYDLYTLAPGGDKLQWDANAVVWQRLGKIGESLGLRWGGRWKQRDMGHFEYVAPAEDHVIPA